ncbi:MAG: selenocysteine-specific translation elongation factor [Myxococcales bacterium]|nr:selenocysteine-specific translation elongation factor [Myxococcales bacterium]
MATLARVIGTAGHIDHGKTSLVRALTGIDTDRLKEEKERGITIELGFAHLELPGGETVGVVDVPGHERFVRAMVAGAVGIDLVVLVVAADEGVMPQTREHLDICGLLGIQRGVVALSKADLVDGELRELAVADVAETLEGTFLEEAPIIACSTKTGEGLEAVKAAIAAALREAPGKDPEGLTRLPIDRVFSMKGFGTVVTGTLWAGKLRAGDDLVALPLLPGGEPGKLRGVQVHGATVAEARAGNRTAVNLTTAKEWLARGQTLVRPGELEAGRLVDVRLRYLATSKKALKRRARLLVHAGTAQTLATISLLDASELAPGGTALAQLQLDEPMVMLPGDRFILRGFAMQRHHGTTVGGGVVLRTLGKRVRRGTPDALQVLRDNERAAAANGGAGDVEARVRLEVARAGEQGIARAALQMRLAYPPRVVDAALAKLSAARDVVRYDKERGALIDKEALASLGRAAVAAVEAFHAAQPLAAGMPREELRAKVSGDVKLLHLVLETVGSDGTLVVERDTVRLPSHDPARDQARAGLAPLAERTLAVYAAAGLQPPRPVEAAATLAVDPKELAPVVDMLVRGGSLVRMKDLVFHAPAVDEIRAKLVAYLQAHAEISPQQWKDLVGASRKFTIPLAEHFDGEKLTMRVGEVRKLRGIPKR